jgi:hypothetical protein
MVISSTGVLFLEGGFEFFQRDPATSKRALEVVSVVELFPNQCGQLVDASRLGRVGRGEIAEERLDAGFAFPKLPFLAPDRASGVPWIRPR